jgi:hypothetical protein
LSGEGLCDILIQLSKKQPLGPEDESQKGSKHMQQQQKGTDQTVVDVVENFNSHRVYLRCRLSPNFLNPTFKARQVGR